MAGRKKRDKYGRFKGKAGIKPYKSNLKGNKRKARQPKPVGPVPTPKSSGKPKKTSKKKIALGIAAGAALGVAASRGGRTGQYAALGLGTAAIVAARRNKPKKKGK